MGEVLVREESLRAIADAIRTRSGGAETYLPGEMAAAIRSLPTSVEEPAPREVNFYGPTGSLAAAYTLEEARALAALPEGPEVDGLVFQGWNWTLEGVRGLTRPMEIGAMYITEDGSTRLTLVVDSPLRLETRLSFSQTVSKGVSIQWGDGSPAETVAGMGKVKALHSYDGPGEYHVVMTPTARCRLGLGHKSAEAGLVGGGERGARAQLRRLEVGKNVTALENYALYQCRELTALTLPEGIKSVGESCLSNAHALAFLSLPRGCAQVGKAAFQSCAGLERVSLPEDVAAVGERAFQSCGRLSRVTLPEGITALGEGLFQYGRRLAALAVPAGASTVPAYFAQGCDALRELQLPEGLNAIAANAFQGCGGLIRVEIPASVTSIEEGAFQGDSYMREYRLRPEIPPALNSTALTGIADDCVIYVPAGSLETYRADPNWSALAGRISAEEQGAAGAEGG